jgi:MYXO-CTERM domain-containing protein
MNVKTLSRLETHLAASVAVAAVASAAQAVVVTWNINQAIPANFDGLYVKIDTQQVISTAGSGLSGWDVNMYGSTTLNFFASGTAPNPLTTYVRTQGSGGPSSLAGGTVISAASTFANSTTAVISSGGVGANGWQLNAINYFGFRFHNNTTNAINYGYGAIQVGATAAARTLLFIEYGNAGESVTVVPAPAALALLGAAGLVGARRRRA